VIEGVALKRMAVMKKVAGACGIASQVIGVTALTVSVFISPWFSWRKDHLSAFGVDSSDQLIYNSGLILAGILGVIFAIGLGRYFLSGRLGQVGTGGLILGSAAVFTMGVFPRNWDFIHGASTVSFFVCISLGLAIAGAAAINASQMAWGVLTVAAGVLMAAFQLIPGPLAGGAIAQVLACVPWSLWTIASGIMLLMRPAPLAQSRREVDV